MNSANTAKPFPKNDEEWEALIAAAPDAIDDSECPYNPNDPAAVEAFWQKAVMVTSGGPAAVRAALAEKRRGRGAQKAPRKVATTLRLDADVLAALKASGQGWQTRVNTIMREWLQAHS